MRSGPNNSRYVVEAAFDYAVGEKLVNFASAARDHPAFAREQSAVHLFG